MAETADLGAEKLLAATLREHSEAGLQAADYYDPPGFGEALACMMVVGAHECLTARVDAETAKAKTHVHFPDLEGHNDAADAFRHCYWNALMTLHIGADNAKKVADQHEQAFPNDPAETRMDQHNNEAGRKLGARSEEHAEALTLKAIDESRKENEQGRPGPLILKP